MKLFGVEISRVRSQAPAVDTPRTFDSDFVSMFLNQHDRPSLSLLDESRKLVSGNPYASKFVDVCEAFTVGSDVVRLDLSGDGSNAVQTAWNMWIASADIHERSAEEVQRDMVRRLVRDGEIFVRVLEQEDGSLKIHLVDSGIIEYERDGSEFRFGGIVFDEMGRPEEYVLGDTSSFHDRDELDPGTPSETIRVPASKMVHVYRGSNPGHVRGLPWIAPAISTMKRLEAYEDAAMKAFQLAASSPALHKFPKGRPGKTAEQDAGGSKIQIKPGGLISIPNDQDLTSLDLSASVSDYTGTRAAMIATIASGIGISYHSLASDASKANMSSLQVGASEDRAMFREIQRIVGDAVVRIYRRWIANELLRPDGLTTADLRRSSGVRVSYPHIASPLVSRDAQVTSAQIRDQVKSPQQAIRESGGDPQVVADEIVEWRRMTQDPSLAQEQ